MTVKTTGAEIKRFMNDETVWYDGIYWDDAEITINGQVEDDPDDNMPDEAVVTISCGAVLTEDGKDLGTLESYFKKWRKKQSTSMFIVECPNDKLIDVKAAIKAAGGRVK